MVPLEAVATALYARTRQEYDISEKKALEELAGVFPSHSWGIKAKCNEYTTGNYANLWKNELQTKIRRKLEAAGKKEKDYSAWLKDIHYVMMAIYPRALFRRQAASSATPVERYNDNVGWRILLISIPAVGALAAGVASHYQHAQKHDQLGRVSNLLFDVAQSGLASLAAPAALPGRKAGADDRDHRGLLPHQITDVCGVDVSDVAPGGLELGDVRTTTVKKILASYISVQALDLRGLLPVH